MWAALAPGVLVLATGAAGAWALRRWFDPIPWRICAVFAVVLVVFLGPVLFGGQVLLPLDALRGRAPFEAVPAAEPHANPLQGDLLQLIAPALVEVRAAYTRGDWPLWNDAVGAGTPLLADPQAQALQPLALPVLLLPVAHAAGVIAGLRLLGAFLFFYLFARRLALGELAALCGALAWGLGGFLQLWLSWPLANIAVWLPAVLYAVVLLDERERRRDELLLCGALAGLLFSGHPEVVAYGGVVALGIASARVAARGRGRRAAFAGRVLRAAGLAAACAAPALLPASALLPQSVRAAAMRVPAADTTAAAMSALPGHDAAAAATFAPSVRRLLPLVAPNAFGNGRYADPSGAVYWGWSNTNEDASGFAGTVACLLALAACAPRATRRPHERLALVLLAGLVALLGMGAGLAALPAAGQRLVGPAGFLVTLLGACELDRVARGEDRRAALWLAAAGLAGLLLWATLGHRHPVHAEALAVVRVGTLALQLKVLLAVVLLSVLARRWRGVLWGMAALIVWESHGIFGPANPPSPARLAEVATPATEFLRARLGGDPARGDRMTALGGAFPANEPALFGLADVRCYDPAGLADYDRRIAPLLVAPRGNVPEIASAQVANANAAGLLDLLGVRYVLSRAGDTVPAAWRRVYADESVSIHERPGALPRFFLPAAARLDVGDTTPVPAVESAVDGLPAGAVSWTAAGPSAGVRLERRAPEAWRLDLRLAEPRLLASGELQDGSWRVLADGRPAPLARANGPFVGAWLPASIATVDVLYRPAHFLAGLLLAGIALAWTLVHGAEPR